MSKFKVGDVVKYGEVILKIINIYTEKDYIGNWYECEHLKSGIISDDYRDGDLKLYTFTKADLKDNHIVENDFGRKYMWESADKMYFNNDLTYMTYDNSQNDIIAIYEFDKCVWKREWFEEEKIACSELTIEEANELLRADKIEKLKTAVIKIDDNGKVLLDMYNKINEIIDILNERE